MSADKEVLKKFYGITDEIELGDPSVISRRNVHEKIAKWMEKWTPHLTAVTIYMGIFVILLPVIFKKLAINNIYILNYISYSHSIYKSIAITNAFIFAALLWTRFFYLRCVIKDFKKGNISYRDIIIMELYPRNKKEEFYYYFNVIFIISLRTFFLFFFLASLS
jgi:hypothetical protein